MGLYREIGIEFPHSGSWVDMTIEVHMPVEKMNPSSDLLFPVHVSSAIQKGTIYASPIDQTSCYPCSCANRLAHPRS